VINSINQGIQNSSPKKGGSINEMIVMVLEQLILGANPSLSGSSPFLASPSSRDGGLWDLVVK
jgi:hypothetical protein